VPDTPWDPELAPAMRQRRQRVSEEARLNELLADLEPDQSGDQATKPMDLPLIGTPGH
jgi:hypothetical protein